jgi:hypothetical protein
MKKSRISKNQELNGKYQNDCPRNVYSLMLKPPPPHPVTATGARSASNLLMPHQVPHGSRSLSLVQFDAHIHIVIDLGVWDKQISFYNYMLFFTLAFEMKISVAAFQLLVPEISSQCSAMSSYGCHSTHKQLRIAHNLDVCQHSKLDNLHNYLFLPPKLR